LISAEEMGTDRRRSEARLGANKVYLEMYLPIYYYQYFYHLTKLTEE